MNLPKGPARLVRSALVLVVSVLPLVAAGCSDHAGSPGASLGVDQKGSPRTGGTLETEAANPTVPQEPSPFRFTDIAPSGGVTFKHFSGMNPERHFPTANGSGVGIFDYDGDGLLDLYFATGKLIPEGSPPGGTNTLYKNMGDGTFRDDTAKAGLGFQGYCHGVISGDIDNDGDPDVVLCNYGPNVLYVNNGDGTFTDQSKASGISRPGWSSGGAFIDYDLDGDLDLYIANYGDWKYPEDNKVCNDASGKIRMYCSPREVRTVKHFFYRNNGDHTFTDVTDEAGLAREDGFGHGFGVVAADLNEDGKIDLYVTNDQNPNFLFLNNGDGTFSDATDISGAAYDEKGGTQAGMGVDAEDVDGDGRPELFVTNFENEYNTLYKNNGDGNFFDQTASFGLAADAMPWVGWGCGLKDFDSDGWPDIFVANGHVDDNRAGVAYAEPPLLHRNVATGDLPDGSRRFKLATRDAGPYFATTHLGRGAGFADLDNDGDWDIVVNHKDGVPAILRNDTPREGNRWVRLKLVGTVSNRDAIGARVAVDAGKRTIVRQVKGGTGLESSNDYRLVIGLGPVTEITRLTITWPRGASTVL
jgi:hypothetical protein